MVFMVAIVPWHNVMLQDLPTDLLPHVDQGDLWYPGSPKQVDGGSRVKLDRMEL